MIPPLNPWLNDAIRAARQLYEDSDRVTHAARLFEKTLVRVHQLATAHAIRCEAPQVRRFQDDESSPALEFLWSDDASGWMVSVTIYRAPGRRPYTWLYAQNDQLEMQQVESPTDDQIVAALWKYFEQWKRA